MRPLEGRVPGIANAGYGTAEECSKVTRRGTTEHTDKPVFSASAARGGDSCAVHREGRVNPALRTLVPASKMSGEDQGAGGGAGPDRSRWGHRRLPACDPLAASAPVLPRPVLLGRTGELREDGSARDVAEREIVEASSSW